MTGIFQIFDRYKSKALVKNERRKSTSGEPEINTIPTYYLVEEDGIPRKVVPDSSERRSSEASRDSRRSSSADASEVVVKTLTEAQTVQKLPQTQKESPFKDSSKTPEHYPSDAATPKPTVPPRTSVELHRTSRDGHKLPPRSSVSKSNDRSRTNVKEVAAHLDDARDISRTMLQMRESVNKSPFGGREAPRRHSPSVVQRYHSSGDEEQEVGKYHRDGHQRRYQSSGDEKDGHQYREPRRYSSAAESFGEQDEKLDHHRPQFPFEGKEFLRSWHRNEAPRNQIARYMSSGDEMDRRSNMSSGDERGAYRIHGNRQQRASHDQESNRSHWPVDQRYHSAGDAFREESSGEERMVAAQRLYPRRRHHHADERGHKHYKERGEGRRHVAYELHSSGDEMMGQRHVPTNRRHSSVHHAGYRHQSAAELNDHQRYQSEDQVGYKHQTSSASKASRPSSGFEARRYQSSGDERGGHRSFVTRDGRRRQYDPSIDNSWRNVESSDEDREVLFSHHHRSNVIRDDTRRFSSATDAHRRYSVGNDDGHRIYTSFNDDRRGDRSRSSVRDGSKYESATDHTRGVSGEYQNDSHGDWIYSEAAVAPSLLEGHRRNNSVESKGEHRRRGSNSSVVSNKESLKLQSVSKQQGYSRDLPPRSSGSRNTVSPRNLIDIRDLARLNVQVRESSSQTAALRDGHKSSMAPELSAESVTGSHDFREMLRAIDMKDAQRSSEKHGSSRNSVDGRDPPRTSNVSRVSGYQSSTPRRSVDGREHLRASSLHSSRASSVDAQVQLRTNSMDSSSTSGEFKRRGPSVVARLMGLAELPENDTPLPEGKSLQRMLSSGPPAEAVSPPGKTQLHLSEVAQQMKQVAARLHQDSQLRQKTPKRKSKAKSRTLSRSWSPPPAPASQDTHSLNQLQGYGIFGRQGEPGSPLPRQPMSPKHHQMEGMPNVFKKRPHDLTSGDLDQRLHQLRIKNSIQEHRTLKQILEAMHLKGLLHPPQKKSLIAEVNEEETERPLHDFEAKPSSTRANRNEYQEQLNFEDLIRMEGEVQEEPAIDSIDHSGEASIVVMKPVNYHSAMTPPAAAATKEVDVNSEAAAALPGFEREKIEIGHRRRGSERRTGSSGKISRSLESPEQRAADKVQTVEDQSFANVMLSWRERIAADAAKKATVDIAEVKPPSRSKSSALKLHRSQDATTLSKYEKEKRVGSPRVVQESVEEHYSLHNREEYDDAAASRNVLSDVAQEDADHDEDRFKLVERSKSDLQLSAKTAEALAAMETSPSLDRVPAQVAVLRSKRASGKASRSKEKLRASTLMPNFETCSSTDQLVVQSPSHSLNDSKTMSPGADSKAQEECTVEPGVKEVTLEVDVQDVSNEEEDGAHVGELSPLQCTTPVADCEAEEPQDDKMEDAFDDDTLEAHTPEGFSSGRDKCFSEDGAFSLQGADHPSPVSVLDSPIFQEGFHLEELSTSPDSVKSMMLRHEDAEDTPKHDEPAAYEPEPEVLTPRSRASKDTSDPLRDIYTKVARSIELGEREIFRGQSIAELHMPFTTDTSEIGDPSKGKLYVQGVLTESGLTDGASLLAEDAAEIMEFDVFTRKEEELQTAELERIDRGEIEKTEEKRYKESLDRRLIFDCMNEVLERKMSPFMNPQPWGAPVVRRKPFGQRLVDEVWEELKDMHWPTRVAYDALYAVLQKDFMRKGFQWLDFSVEVGEVGCELECMILQELVEEVVQDVRNIKPKSMKVQLPCLQSEALSEVSDDSELRRRELLDKTRRDLLAWHVQYQQL